MTIAKIATKGPMTTRRRNPKVGKDTEEEEARSIERKGRVDRSRVRFGKGKKNPVGRIEFSTRRSCWTATRGTVSGMRRRSGLTREKVSEMGLKGTMRRSKRRRRQIKEIKIFGLRTLIVASDTMNSFNVRNFVSKVHLARTKST